ncbi:hypothetical protein L0F63_001978 [Massospora cicadina]|nr:hypothetical protein L0F63_001978 [Massospora cicadina]
MTGGDPPRRSVTNQRAGFKADFNLTIFASQNRAQVPKVPNPNLPISLHQPTSAYLNPHPTKVGVSSHKTRSRPTSPHTDLGHAQLTNALDPGPRSRPTSPQSGNRSRPTSPEGEHRNQARITTPHGEPRYRSLSRPYQADPTRLITQGHRKTPTGPNNGEPGGKDNWTSQISHPANDPANSPPSAVQEAGPKLAPDSPSRAQPGTDWGFLESFAGRLAYNHLTREARLVHFEGGQPPKRAPLPKGELIPPSQLVMLPPSLNPPARVLSDRVLSDRVLSDRALSDPAPPLPPKSPARQVPVQRPLRLPQATPDDGLPSPDWKVGEKFEPPGLAWDPSKAFTDLLSKAGAAKIANLGKDGSDSPLKSPLSQSVEEDIDERAWGLAADLEPGSLRRRPSSAFEKKAKYVPPQARHPTPLASSIIRPPNWLSLLRPSGENGGMYIAGDERCAILCGQLYKLGGNRQWQRRQFRADGFTLVCLSKEPIRGPPGTGPLKIVRPNYFAEDWRQHYHPTQPPTPRLTHPLLATASRGSHQLAYHQAPKWIIPLGDMVEVSLLTRKGLRVTDSFVIHTRGRNYILRATNQHELASWIYMLQRMIVTYRDCRALSPGFTFEPLAKGPIKSGVSDAIMPPHPTPPAPRAQADDRRTDSTMLLQQQTRRAPNIFQALQGGVARPLTGRQLQLGIALDWTGGLAALSYCRRPSS